MKVKLLFSLMVIGLMVVSCTDDKNDIASIEDIIDFENAADVEYIVDDQVATSRSKGRFTFKTLNQALRCTGLADVVRDQRWTIYAPSDAAFAKLGLDRDNVCSALDAETLTSILLYHVNEENIGLKDDGCFVQINGDIIQVVRNSFRDVRVNDTRTYLRFTSRRLSVYLIEDVLLPSENSIVETAIAADDFSILVDAVLAADPAVVEALSDPDNVFTVLAPTNQAFVDLLGALNLSSLEEVVTAIGIEGLTNILLYHVVDACAVSNTLENDAIIPTLLGEEIKIDLDNLGIIDKAGSSSGLIPELLDIRTNNGVIHAIDRVLLPQAILDLL